MATAASGRRIIMATCKLGEKGCWQDGKCHYRNDCENKVLTNADRIRAMSDEELADVLREFATKPIQGSFLKWLKQPAE